MITGVRFRAYPTAEQAAILRQWIGHQRFIYNAKVAEQDYWYRFEKSSLALTGCRPFADQAYSQFKDPELTPWLSNVPSQILRNGAYRHASANARFAKGLGGAPKAKKKHGRQSVMVTSELFSFVEQPHPRAHNPRNPSLTGNAQGGLRSSAPALKRDVDLFLGTPKHPMGSLGQMSPMGRLRFKAHSPWETPKSLTLSVEPSGQWYVSFCFECAPCQDAQAGPVVLRTEAELMYEFSLRPDLAAITVGIDRGVAIPAATSQGCAFTVSAVCAQRIGKKEKRARRYQRQMARQEKGSKNRLKARCRCARLKAYAANVRKDFAHKASAALVASPAQIFAFEDLKLKNMTASPKPKKDEAGRWTANGSAAKAGLSKALLSSALGLIRQFTAYKASRCNKLVLSVPAAYSSQECSVCRYTDALNRQSQGAFACVQCGHSENADFNAAKVVQQRGVRQLQAYQGLLAKGAIKVKIKRAVRVRKIVKTTKAAPSRPITVGQGMPEPSSHVSSTPVESASVAGRGLEPLLAQCSQKQETPAIALA